jgi:hypothetical protein
MVTAFHDDNRELTKTGAGSLCTSASQRARKTISLLYPIYAYGMRSKRVVFCVLRALYADFPLRATGSLLALIDFTRSADDAPSSDNP